MHPPIGHTQWAIADGYLPLRSPDETDPRTCSHETACLLNAGDADATVRLTIFFTDREPVGPYEVTVPARRTVHLRFDDLQDPEPIPRDTDYACIIESDYPIVVQHTRLDVRSAELGVLSTLACAG
ncbi:MAG: sensory rhodopsin transducer [Thauera sp.]|nr:sensory rhodopsin transducer [Thauera sp.]